MADRPQEEVIEESAVEETPPAETEVTESEAEVAEEEPEVEETTEEAEKPEEKVEESKEPEKPSRRESLRIQKLLEQRRDLQNELNEVKQHSDEDYRTRLAIEADDEIIERLETDRQAYGQSQYQQGIDQGKTIQFKTRLEVDAPRVEAKYDFLNPESENFDPARAGAMNQLYLNTVGYTQPDPTRRIPESVANPNIRYKDFVEAQMEFAEALLADRQISTTKNIARQAATTGLRPDGSTVKRLDLNKAPQDMTDEELKAIVSRIPKK